MKAGSLIYKFFRSVIALLLVHSLSVSGQGDSKLYETYYEKSGFTETPRYDKMVRYCRQIADVSPLIHYTSFGISAQGRELPLLIVDKNGNFDPMVVRNTENVVLLIQACIHPGEPDGKDAGLMLIRDVVFTKKFENLLDHVTLLFIPIFNVDGHERFGPYNRINQNGPKETGWRTNAQNLNLNRDYIKAESPEIQSWIQLFNQWLPDFFIDCHVTDGADYQYALTYGMEIHGNMDADLSQWQINDYLKPIEEKMISSGFPVSPYVTYRKWHDPRSGLVTWATSPMLSTGYVSLRNRPSLLIETHMLKDYKTRVDATYEMLRNSLEILNREQKKLIRLNRQADEKMLSLSFRSEPFPLTYETSFSDSIMIPFLGVDYEVIKSDLTGGDWFRYSKTPKTFEIPYFNKVNPKKSTNLPLAYIIPPEWRFIHEKLILHNIHFQTLIREARITVQSYKFTNVKFRNSSFEGRQTVDASPEAITEERVFPVGSMLIPVNQQNAKIVAHLLEPDASSSLLWWGYFNAIFEQKEYTESYVMEEMARKMFNEDPSLLKELNEKKARDPHFGEQPYDVLNWFYQKSPYWDSRKDIYPIGRIMDASVLQSITR